MVDSKQAMRRMAQRRRSEHVCAGDWDGPLQALLAAATTVASYLAVGQEPAVPPRPGWLLPVLRDDDDLDWAVFDGHLTQGRHGLIEPAGPRRGLDAVAACDLVLVPALLVDLQGHRLGKGGGSYDRALTRATGLTVALLHDGEIVDDVPVEEHDVAVKAVATPSSGLIYLPAKM